MSTNKKANKTINEVDQICNILIGLSFVELIKSRIDGKSTINIMKKGQTIIRERELTKFFKSLS